MAIASRLAPEWASLTFVIPLVEVMVPVAGSKTLVVAMAYITSGTVASEGFVVVATTVGFG